MHILQTFTSPDWAAERQATQLTLRGTERSRDALLPPSLPLPALARGVAPRPGRCGEPRSTFDGDARVRGWSRRAAVAGGGEETGRHVQQHGPSCLWSVPFPPKNMRQTQSCSHGAARPAAEVLRGWRGEGGSGRGGRRDQSCF